MTLSQYSATDAGRSYQIGSQVDPAGSAILTVADVVQQQAEEERVGGDESRRSDSPTAREDNNDEPSS